MIRGKPVWWTFAISLVAACGGDEAAQSQPLQAVLTAGTLGEQAITPVSDYLADPRYANADRKNGETQARICRACHSLDKAGPNMIGPNLHGVFGKSAGRVAGFSYSETLAGAGFVWTPRALDAWLAQPTRFLPGNRMTFAGVMDEGARNDLIAYLLEVTDDSQEE